MKAIKISLVVIVITVITYFTIQSFVTTDKVGKVQQGSNPFIEKIQQKINDMRIEPNDHFSKDYYKEVVYLIEDFHTSNKFSNNQASNNQWKENFSKQLYSAYVDKFIKQAFYVFQNLEWDIDDLNFIRTEYKILQKSPFLETGSLVDLKFDQIESIFGKYDAISSFINECNSFSYMDNNKNQLGYDFPIYEVNEKINRSKQLLDMSSYMEIKNCRRLISELEIIPEMFFERHYNYLDTKINYWLGAYRLEESPKSYRLYSESIYKPLSTEINELKNLNYNVSTLNTRHNELKRKWDTELDRAYIFYEENN